MIYANVSTWSKQIFLPSVISSKNTDGTASLVSLVRNFAVFTDTPGTGNRPRATFASLRLEVQSKTIEKRQTSGEKRQKLVQGMYA